MIRLLRPGRSQELCNEVRLGSPSEPWSGEILNRGHCVRSRPCSSDMRVKLKSPFSIQLSTGCEEQQARDMHSSGGASLSASLQISAAHRPNASAMHLGGTSGLPMPGQQYRPRRRRSLPPHTHASPDIHDSARRPRTVDQPFVQQRLDHKKEADSEVTSKVGKGSIFPHFVDKKCLSRLWAGKLSPKSGQSKTPAKKH